MSTKSSIRHESDDESNVWFHLYSEAYDEEHVYLGTAGKRLPRWTSSPFRH